MYREVKCYFVETELDFLFCFPYKVLAPRKFECMTLRVLQFFLKIDFFGTTHRFASSPRLRSPSLIMAPALSEL